jgi:hypothetical protein
MCGRMHRDRRASTQSGGQKTESSKPLVPADPEVRDLAAVRTGDLDVPLARHHYSLGVVASCLALVLYGGTPLRRVPAVLAMSWSWAGVNAATGSYYSARLWLLRLGLYQLRRPKEQADDWMWIVDHTLQIGDHKCLIVVAIRQSTWYQLESRVLRHEDVDLIDLQPVTESNGKVVYRQLQSIAAKTGVPRAIISDNGSDLHCGIALFRDKHPGTAWMYDIKHKTACLLKHALEQDVSWQSFVEEVHRFKQQVYLTELAGLAPPQQRSKARYMNVDVLTAWAERHLQLLDSRKAIRAAGLKRSQVEAKLGWLRKFAPQVRRWGEMLALIEATEHYVRHEGVHAQAAVDLAAALPQPRTPAARQLRKQLLEFVEEEGKHACEGERLLGSSEVLESIIGKYKYMAGERGHHGMTGMVLSIGAFVGSQVVATVQAAMNEITNRDVWTWCRSHLGSSVQGVRRRITSALRPEQKQQPLRVESG